jgi:hypothetical protein
MKCCKDETLSFKIKDSFSSVNFEFNFSALFYFIPNLFSSVIENTSVFISLFNSPLVNAPPLPIKSIVSFPVFFQSFLI